MTYKVYFSLSIIIFLFSCNQKTKNKDYTNTDEYIMKVGETVKIYYTTNSCCTYCQPNRYELKHVEYVGEEVEVPMKKNCDGCNATYSLIFKANSIGRDTIFGQIITASSICPDSSIQMNKYIFTIE